MLETIVSLYCEGKNEKQIKEELILLGHKKSVINKEFKLFTEKFKTVNEVKNYNLLVKSYNKLKEIQANYPQLTYIAKGYDGLSREIKEAHKEQISEITGLLKSLFSDFRSFQNFTPSKDNKFTIRCQFAYDASFTGVHYLTENDFNIESHETSKN